LNQAAGGANLKSKTKSAMQLVENRLIILSFGVQIQVLIAPGKNGERKFI
jgi:hypothetical protein